jgi:IS4 transposase
MFSCQLLELFARQSPVSVMLRGVLGNALSDDRLNQVFEESAKRQYCRELTFAMCVDLMADVVTSIRPSINAAFAAKSDELPVSVVSVYKKINGLEPSICEHLVRSTAVSMAAIVDELGWYGDEVFAGREVRILDGNHLAGTDHRIKELRRLGAAALPGQSIPILDPHRKIIDGVVTCENGHTSERKLIPQVLALVQPKQCWIADSNFCTLDFMFGIKERKAHFVVRHHGNLRGEPVGRSRKAGTCSTGAVYEQALRILSRGEELTIRRITIQRDKPTKKGMYEVVILSNLPESVSAEQIAHGYRERWTIETAFQEITENLQCEISTLGHPKAALFAFSLALVIYNALSVVKAALHASAKKPIATNLSMYALTDEVAGVWRGMQIAVPEESWPELESLSLKQFVAKLRAIAKHADLKRLSTYKWTPKRPQPKRKSGKRGSHVATSEILDERTNKRKSARK